MSANFVQVSGPGGRVQFLTAGTATQTFLFNPSSLRGMLPGGDYLYAERARCRLTFALRRTASGAINTPNWEQLAQAFGAVRVWSPFLGEVVNKSLTNVALLANHDAMFANGMKTTIRERPQLTGSATADLRTLEYEFEIPFARDYLTRPEDSCPWLPLFEGGQIEVDLRPATALGVYGWNMEGTVSAELVIDWFPDRQPCIHTPVQSRTYRVVTIGPEYTLKAVGSSNGLDGAVQGCRLAVLSWLGSGASETSDAHDSGYYSTFGAGGILFGTAGVNRLDIPFRDQVSIDAVSAWISSFLSELSPVRHLAANAPPVAVTFFQNDMFQWPYARNPFLTSGAGAQSYINDGLNFWPLVWSTKGQKITDLQKVAGDLSFTATLTTPPSDSVLHLFRTDEVCALSKSKVMDIMDRMNLPHVERGGTYLYVPKYQGAKRAGESTQWGLPLKIIEATTARRAA
jgi:hypothetical protein